MSFNFTRLAIPDIILIEPAVFPDERGFFIESYKYSEFSAFGIKEHFVQHNHSRSVKSVLRGLHYQRPPKAQGKLVRVVVGEIFDVGVDIRQGSPTYGKWVGERLSAENKRMLYIPPGFAHGFCVLNELAEVLEIGIQWPLEHPILSAKDAALPTLRETLRL
jgi:dTDP-4-dehydrorhamnose 3,5-epimerase